VVWAKNLEKKEKKLPPTKWEGGEKVSRWERRDRRMRYRKVDGSAR
jgi:hypothetical protein